MVHSEDLRPLGHLRYFFAPLYQVLTMEATEMRIEVTLPDGSQVQRQGRQEEDY